MDEIKAGSDDVGVDVLLLDASSTSCPSHMAGGKGHNLWMLGRMEGCQVPPWFCVTAAAFNTFIQVSIAPFILYVNRYTTSVYTTEQFLR